MQKQKQINKKSLVLVNEAADRIANDWSRWAKNLHISWYLKTIFSGGSFPEIALRREKSLL